MAFASTTNKSLRHVKSVNSGGPSPSSECSSLQHKLQQHACSGHIYLTIRQYSANTHAYLHEQQLRHTFLCNIVSTFEELSCLCIMLHVCAVAPYKGDAHSQKNAIWLEDVAFSPKQLKCACGRHKLLWRTSSHAAFMSCCYQQTHAK